MVLTNSDKDMLMKSKAQLSDALTQKLNSDPKNANSKVQVNDVRTLPDGNLELDIACTGVSDHDQAKKTFQNAVNGDEVKQHIAKSSKTNAGPAKPEQKASPPQSECNSIVLLERFLTISSTAFERPHCPLRIGTERDFADNPLMHSSLGQRF